MKLDLPVFEDVLAAAKRLEGMAVKTPVMESLWLNDIVGGRVFIKPECLQRTGSFKFRGAWNFISQLDRKSNPGGVVAFSSGNHAQGVAAAAAIQNLPTLIVMPADSPAIKIANTKALGAEIVTYDRASEDRQEVTKHHLAVRNAVLVPPFDHKFIMAGQGTVALELVDWAQENQLTFDQLLVPTGGGGLVGGSALVFTEKLPEAEIFSVEPEKFDDYRRSLIAGKVVANEATTGSICDAIMTPSPGTLTFAVNQTRLTKGLVVDDNQVRQAMRFAFERLKLVVEPGGAVALAAILNGKIDCKGRNTAIILSGGNVDPDLFASVL